VAEKILERYPLCDRCLGRLFAGLGAGLSNLERGRAIKLLLAMGLHSEASIDPQHARGRIELYAANAGEPFSTLYRRIYGQDPVKPSPCHVCGSRVEELIAQWVKRVGEVLRAMGYRRFILGVKPPEISAEAEENVARAFSLQHWETIKNELKREIGKGVAIAYGFEPDFDDPEVMLVLDIPRSSIEAVVPSMIVNARLVKLVRGYSVKRRPGGRSIEDIASTNLRGVGEGLHISIAVRDTSRYRILGRGCHTVIEIRSPRPGHRDLAEVSKALNSMPKTYMVEVIGRGRRRDADELAGRVRRITYRIYIYSDREVAVEELEKLKESGPILLEQRTPVRILRRGGVERAYPGELRVEATHQISKRTFELVVTASSRIYIEEAVTGDGGRTRPSISSIIGAALTPLEVDILSAEV